MSRRALQVVLRFLGLTAMFFGALTAFGGAPTIIGAGEASATLDSELRYFAIWYVPAGFLLFFGARHVEAYSFILRLLMGTLFLGGLSRAIGILVNGLPHPVSVTLMALELTIPLVIVPWQASVARGAGPPADEE